MHFDTAEQLIAELLPRGASKVDEAAVYHLKVRLHTLKSENARSCGQLRSHACACSASTCRHIPTQEQVQAEYETVWQILDGRPIESLIDLPLMTDPELQAAMQVLSDLAGPAYFTDFHLFCLLTCRMVNVSMQHGMSGASAHGYVHWGILLGPGPFTVTVTVIVSPSLHAILSRNMASSPTRRKSTVSMEIVCPLDATDRDRDRFQCGAAVRAAIETG